MDKILAVDLDGTVLDSKGQMTEGVRAALLNAQSAGFRLVLCTGRPLSGVRAIARALELSEGDWIVTNNGSCVQTLQHAVLAETRLSLADYQRVAHFCDSHDLSLIAVGGGRVYTHQSFVVPQVSRFCWLTDMPLVVTPFGELEHPLSFYKCMICADSETIRIFKDQISCRFGDVYQCVQSEACYLEILPAGVSKGAALKRVAREYQISPAAIIGIGDNDNDRSMLAFAGTAIAMGNAVPEIKRLAHWVCPTNDEDGVAVAIDWIVKNRI